MNNLQVYSIVEKIAESIETLIPQIEAGNKKIAIYGLDTFSFATQSLLKNKKNTADYYLSYEDELIEQYRRKISGFSARFVKNMESTIEIYNVQFIDPTNIVLLVASRITEKEIARLESDGFIKNKNLFILYDWSKDLFRDFTDHKKKIQLNELQKIEKKILKKFDEFCINHNLRYWVCGGTLLGTIRHKGFIPWDDDIDVFMPWEDYQKLIKTYQDTDEYRLVCLDKEKYIDKYYLIWAKIVENTTIAREDAGVMHCIHPAWIDIFPIIGMPSDINDRSNLQKEVIEIERKFTESFYRGNGSIKNRNTAYEYVLEVYNRYDFEKSDYVGVIGTAYREKDVTSRKVYADTIRMQFEDIEVNVPIGYKEYLDNLYGKDWMEIPEESKRKAHNLEAYWL